jgi:mannose-1-phosphate guanylyltransferase/mannose-1-phosphate guanylyltransferase/mannose-6-phosphate isomerase
MRDDHCPKTRRASIRIVPVILCGGSGTRLWPLSRETKPKQLLALTGSETMFQLALGRVADADLFAPPLIVAGAEQADMLEAQAREIGVETFTLLIEPCARSTGGAIGLAAASVPPDQQLLVLPSDHLIQDPAAFVAGVRSAIPFADSGWLVTFGVRPSRPETGYGYIRRADRLAPGIYRAAEFVEKPDLATAERFVAEGQYDWNAGIFQFRAGTLRDEMVRQAPIMADASAAAMAAAETVGLRSHPDAAKFALCPSPSIDKAVMEHAGKVAVVPVEIGWSDLGSWDAMHDISPKDAGGNVVKGPITLIGSSNCLIHSDGPEVAALGLDDLIVVVSGSSILVVPKSKSHLVKQAVEAMKKPPPDP